jgi:hypothetical protein
MPETAPATSFRLKPANTGPAAKVRSDAKAKPREIFIQTSSWEKLPPDNGDETGVLTGNPVACSGHSNSKSGQFQNVSKNCQT